MARSMILLGATAALVGAGLHKLLRIRPLAACTPPRPAHDYTEAVRRLDLLQEQERRRVSPICTTQLLTHGHRMANVIVFLHGFTNCPHQFHQLATLFFERGYNVLNARIPRHGMADLMTTELAYLRADEMATLTNEVVDLAQGLGDEVTLFGFSLGGTLAAWAAQQRADLQRVVVVSPSLGIRALKPWQGRIYANLLVGLPNQFRWWDPILQHTRQAPAHVYPRFTTRGLAELLRMGCIVQHDAQRKAPAARAITVITNPCDEVVDNAATAATVAHWRRHGATVTTYEFPAEWQLIHDLMDPGQPKAQVARVYPQLLTWVLNEAQRG